MLPGDPTTASTKRRKVVRRKPQGEFVWVSDGSCGQYPAQLVVPIHDNPPQHLADSDMVEVQYTSSGLFDWAEKQYIEYPNPSTEESVVGSRRSTPRKRKARDNSETSSPAPPSMAASISKVAVPTRSPKRGISVSSVSINPNPDKKKGLAVINGNHKSKSKFEAQVGNAEEHNADEEDIFEDTKEVAEIDDKEEMEAPSTKRQKIDASESSSVLDTLAPLWSAGKTIFNNLFGKN